MEHPITPPPELVAQWSDIKPMEDAVVQNWVKIATAAAQWGADQELEACCEWLKAEGYPGTVIDLRAARRPKPLSEADLALDALGPEPLPENTPSGYTFLNGGAIEGHRRIRRALERLKELEACLEHLSRRGFSDADILGLRAARRPKPPSLKEQALLQLDTLNADLAMHGRGCDLSQIRRALEQLND